MIVAQEPWRYRIPEDRGGQSLSPHLLEHA
jgi:hypothetical protein